jgi:uncharacterized membrane protein YhiD involved in acid resistance
MTVMYFLAGLSIVLSLVSLWTVAEMARSVTENTEKLIRKGHEDNQRKVNKLQAEQAGVIKKLDRLDKDTQIAIQDFTRSRKRQDDELSEVRAWFKDYEDTHRIRKSA